MLVLSRNIGQSIFIGDLIKVTLHSTKSSRCRLQVSRSGTEGLRWYVLEESDSLCLSGPGQRISLMITELRPGRVKIGITAPGLKIMREELLDDDRR